MMDIKTIKFIALLDELARRSKVGYLSINRYNGNYNGIIYVDPDMVSYQGDAGKHIPGKYVVSATEYSPTIGRYIATANFGFNDKEYAVRMVDIGEAEFAPYVVVMIFGEDENLEIIVKNGVWHFAGAE